MNYKGFWNYLNRTAFLVPAFFLMLSCSTKKNALINRAYHNLTARDNGYFNAKLKVEDGERRLEEAHVDKYDRILSVFRYADKEKAKAVASVMDEAIKKSSLVIQRHSMLINGVEYCKWIDENYLIIGKANFYKREFQPAIENFQYVIAQFREQDSRYEALLWMAKIFLDQGNLEDAENTVDYLNGEPKFPKQLKEELAAVSATYALRQKNYGKAITELNKAIKFARKRARKTRYMFILAQVYQREEQYKKAFEMYGKVIQRNPAYEMAFNAKINRARSFDPHNSKSETVKKELFKMLKDEKNKEYLDQIYYALGTIALQEKDVETAIKYLNMSVRESTLNTNQKALSYLELGKIYYSRPDYRKADAYFDSTISVVARDHPDYDLILDKRNSLNKLIKYIKTIETEDSLQRIAGMSVKDRDAFIEKLIEKQKEEDERKRKEEEERKQKNALLQQNTFSNNTASGPAQGATWYFYNPSAMSFGYTEFVRKWGNRPNEDNWRRSNKEPIALNIAAEEEQGSAAAGSDTTGDKSAKYNKEKYYRNLPLGPKQMEKSHQKIIDAFYNLSLIYKEQFQDYAESAKAGEELLKRYPDNHYMLAIYYNLYLVYSSMGNQPRSDFYKNLLLEKYPDSEYSQLILDPDYFKNNKGKAAQLYTYYKETYQLLGKGQFEEVLKRINEADKLFPGNKLKPKFEYLRALVTGRTRGVEAYTSALKDIILKFPEDEVKDKAVETLEFIALMKDRSPESPGQKARELYAFSPDTVHFYVILFNNPAHSDKIRALLEQYNKKHYGQSPFEILPQVIDKDLALIVKNFTDKDAAQDYQYGISQDAQMFSGIENTILHQFVISPANLDVLVKDGNIGQYMIFYKLNYPEVAHF